MQKENHRKTQGEAQARIFKRSQHYKLGVPASGTESHGFLLLESPELWHYYDGPEGLTRGAVAQKHLGEAGRSKSGTGMWCAHTEELTTVASTLAVGKLRTLQPPRLWG